MLGFFVRYAGVIVICILSMLCFNLVIFMMERLLSFNMHPFVKMLMFLWILVVAGFATAHLLISLLLLVFAVAIKVQPKVFWMALWRMRWLFVSIFLIYAFATPGELVPLFPIAIAPSFEGLNQVLLQISRLLIALAALNVLLATTSKESLMLGLYILLQPLKYIGMDIERFSARLLLTLAYVEQIALAGKAKFSFKHFNDIHRELQAMPAQELIYFEATPFTRIDKILMVFMLLMLIGMIGMRFF